MAAPVSQADLDLIFARTRDLWGEMRSQRVFITGGTGFFGCWLTESFAYANRMLALDARATILTRDPSAFRQKCSHLALDPAISLLRGDVQDFAYPDGDFQYVIHAATESSLRQAPQKPQQMTETILRGTERVLEFAARHGTRRFLLTSSGAVYGSQPASMTHLAEDYAVVRGPLGCVSEYAEGKRAAESMCAAHSNKYGIELKIARGFAFVGPHLPLDAHFAIGNFIRDAMRGTSIEVNGDGTPKRSYMYAADLAVWLWTILFRGPANQVFNVGSDQVISVLELAHAVASAIGSPAPVRVAQKATAGAEAQQYVPSISKAQQQLGLACEVTLQDAIRRTAAWHGYRRS